MSRKKPFLTKFNAFLAFGGFLAIVLFSFSCAKSIRATPFTYTCTNTPGAYDGTVDNFLGDNGLVKLINDVPAGSVVQVSGTCALTRLITINKAITLEGPAIINADPAWHIFTGGSTFRNNLINITDVPSGQAVVLTNLTLNDAKRSGIDIVNSDNVTLNDLTIDSCSAAGVVINGADVVANNLNTSNSDWGIGVNVGLDSKSYPSGESHFNWVSGSADETYGAIAVDTGMNPDDIELIVSGKTETYDPDNGMIIAETKVKVSVKPASPVPTPRPSVNLAPQPTSFTGPATAPTCGDNVPTGTADLFQINRQGSQVTLNFSPVNGARNYHVIYGHEMGDQRYALLSGSVQTVDNYGVQKITINDLDQNQNYWFTVAPVNGCAVGNWSNWLEAKGAGKRGIMSIFYR